MKTLVLLLLATATAVAAPACPKDKQLPAEIPAVGCPKKVEPGICSPCLKNMVAYVLHYEGADGNESAWRGVFEELGWKVTKSGKALVARKGHDTATLTFQVAHDKRTVHLVFQPG